MIMDAQAKAFLAEQPPFERAELLLRLLVKAKTAVDSHLLLTEALEATEALVTARVLASAAATARKFRPEDRMGSDCKSIQWHTAEEIAREFEKLAKAAT